MTFRASLRVIILVVRLVGDSFSIVVTPLGGVENSSWELLESESRLDGFGDDSGWRISTIRGGELSLTSWVGNVGCSIGISADIGCETIGIGIDSVGLLEVWPFNSGVSFWIILNCFASKAKLSVGPLGRSIDWIDTKDSTQTVATWNHERMYILKSDSEVLTVSNSMSPQD